MKYYIRDKFIILYIYIFVLVTIQSHLSHIKEIHLFKIRMRNIIVDSVMQASIMEVCCRLVSFDKKVIVQCNAQEMHCRNKRWNYELGTIPNIIYIQCSVSNSDAREVYNYTL